MAPRSSQISLGKVKDADTCSNHNSDYHPAKIQPPNQQYNVRGMQLSDNQRREKGDDCGYERLHPQPQR